MSFGAAALLVVVEPAVGGVVALVHVHHPQRLHGRVPNPHHGQRGRGRARRQVGAARVRVRAQHRGEDVVVVVRRRVARLHVVGGIRRLPLGDLSRAQRLLAADDCGAAKSRVSARHGAGARSPQSAAASLQISCIDFCSAP